MCFSSVHGAFIQLGLCNAGRHHLPQTMEVSSVISFPYEIPSILCTPKWIDSILNRTKQTFLRWCCQSCYLFLLIRAWMPIALHDVFFFFDTPRSPPRSPPWSGQARSLVHAVEECAHETSTHCHKAKDTKLLRLSPTFTGGWWRNPINIDQPPKGWLKPYK